MAMRMSIAPLKALEKPIVAKKLTAGELATDVGCSDKTIRRYWRRGCPRDSVAAVVKWRSENIKAVAEDAEPSEVMAEIKRAELEKTLEAAKGQRLKNEALEGGLIDRMTIQRDLSLAFARIRDRLLSLGTQCANLAPGDLKAPVKNLIDEQVRVAMKELANSELRDAGSCRH